MPDHGLTQPQINKIRTILAPYSEVIEQVGLFGSRATGKAKHYSDIDLVLYGDIDGETLDRLWTLFDLSDLPLHVDVTAYNLISNRQLKSHIDTVVKPLFTQSDLCK